MATKLSVGYLDTKLLVGNHKFVRKKGKKGNLYPNKNYISSSFKLPLIVTYFRDKNTSDTTTVLTNENMM